MNFFKTPAFLKYLYPQLLWDRTDKKTGSPCIYLTFDDGPVPGTTDFVLATLEKYKAKATFFCVGENVQKHPEVYQSVLRNQHHVGNHTFNHLNGWQTDDPAYLENIALCDNMIDKHASSKKLFRPPYGKIKRSQISRVRQDYQIVMWSILSGDFDPGFNAEKCLKKCITHTKHGTIIIFHDSYKAEKNLKYVLPRYLEHFAAAGYHFSAL